MIKVIFASFEFAVTVLFGAILYLWCVLYFAVCMYLNELRALFAGAVATWSVRIQAARVDGSATEKPGVEQGSSSRDLPRCGPVGRGRFESWLN